MKYDPMSYAFFLYTSIAVLVVSVVFTVYYFIGQSQRVSEYLKNRQGSDKGQVNLILFQRMLGVILFGLVPAIIILLVYKIPLSSFGFDLRINVKSFFWILAIGVIIFLVNVITSTSQYNLSKYPQIRSLRWSYSLILLSAISWIAYLLAYEFMFRGFLFFSCVKEMGAFAAISINISLYCLVHIPKGLKEAAGALILGLILCLLTLRFGTIWAAFWIHCILALSNEWLSLKFNPDIRILNR
jgi:uncharacterized protein